MKLVYVLDSLGTGGAERSTADLWYYLRSKEIQATIIVLRHRHEGIEKEILEQGFSVFFLSQKGFFKQCLEIITLLKKLKPDIVHSVLFKSNLRVRFSKLGLPFMHIESLVNCTYDPVRLKDPRIGLLSFYFYKCLDYLTTPFVNKYVAITNTVKQHYIQELGIPAEKIRVIYRGREENHYLQDREKLRSSYFQELGLRGETLLILHVGRKEFQKGHLVLLEAIKQIEDKLDTPVAFIFLGRQGNSSQDINQYLEKAKLNSKLFFLDHRYDVAQWMASADIFVFPSLYEGLGGVMIEAQAASLPILCSDIPVLNEVVLKSENAVMFDVGNAQKLGECLLALINDKPRRMAMGKKSLRNFRDNFTQQKIHEESLSVYEKMMTNKK